jgi:phage-related minor tail protein
MDNVSWREIVGNINIDLLLSIDVSRLQSVDTIPLLDKLDSNSIYAIYSIYNTHYVLPILKLEDLDRIDWDAVVTEVRGWGDLWGQVVKPIIDAISGWIDTLKKFFESVIDPIKSKIMDIWSIVSGIPSTLSNILNALRSVVLDPLIGALNWISQNFPSIVKSFQDLVKLITDTIASLPAKFSEIVGYVTRLLSGAVDVVLRGLNEVGRIINSFLTDLPKRFEDVRKIISDFVDAASKVLGQVAEAIRGLPTVIASALEEAGKVLSSWVDAAKKVLGEVWEKIAGIPSIIADAISRFGAGLAEFSKIIANAFDTIKNLILSIPKMIEEAGNVVSSFVDTVRHVLSSIVSALTSLPKSFADLANAVTKKFEELRDLITGGLDVVKRRFEDIEAVFSAVIDSMRRSIEGAGRVLSSFIDMVMKLPSIARDVFDAFVKAFYEARRKWDEFVDALRQSAKVVEEKWSEFVSITANAMVKAREVLANLIHISDFIERVRKGAEFVWTLIKDFITNPLKAVVKYIINPLLSYLDLPTIPAVDSSIAKFADGAGLHTLVLFGGAPEQERKPWYVQAYEAIKGALEFVARWLYDRAIEFINWVREKVIETIKTISIGLRNAAELLANWAFSFLSPWLKKGSPIAIAALPWMRSIGGAPTLR